MRLPINAMQSVRLRSLQADTEQWYRSVIIDFEEEQELVLILPGKKDLEDARGQTPGDVEVEEQDEKAKEVGDDSEFLEPPPFDRGARLEVEVSFPDGIRKFTSVVKRLDLKYGGSMRIEWPSAGTRIQRRDFVRVDVQYRALVWYKEGDGPLQQINGFTLNVSAGGVRLKLPQPLPDDQRIEVEIQTPPLADLTLQGRVVRSGELEKGRKEAQFYWVAVEYVGVDEGLRNDMTQMVFDIQREQMKRSLT